MLRWAASAAGPRYPAAGGALAARALCGSRIRRLGEPGALAPSSSSSTSGLLRRWMGSGTGTGSGFQVSDSVAPEETRLTYTVRVEGKLDEARAAALTARDVHALFGAFEPYNIRVRPKEEGERKPPGKGKGHRGYKEPLPLLATFQVPSLRYAQEVAESFQHDETWGERITVTHERASFPVFMSGLPEGVSGEELKKQVEAAAGDPRALKAQGQSEGKGEGMLAGTAVDVYDTYAVFRCPDKYTSLGLLQGAFQLSPAPKGKGGNGKDKEKAAAGGEEGASAPEAAAAAPAVSPAEEAAAWEDDEEVKGVLSYAAWRTFPVRVNGLHPETTAEELRTAFAKYMPYDVDLLPAAHGSRSAYLRFARPEQGRECASEMRDVTLKGATMDVRPAWEKLFPVLVEGQGQGQGGLAPAALVTSLRTQGLDVVDAEAVAPAEGEEGAGGEGSGSGSAVLVRFATPAGAEEGLKHLQARVGGGGGGRGQQQVRAAWKDFRIDLVNLPRDCGESDLRRLVHLTSPARAVVGGPAGDSGRRRGSLSFATRGEAELAFSQLSGAGLPDLKLRKAWAVYRLTVKGLPLDTTEAELREALRGYEPDRVDFLRSKKGNPKGEALLRFAAYDQLRAAIARLYGRDSPLDEAESSARWATAADGLSFDDPLPDLEEAVAAAEAAGAAASTPGEQLEAAVARALKAEDGEAREVMERTLLTEADEAEAARHGALVDSDSAAGGDGEDEEDEEDEEEAAAAAGEMAAAQAVNPFAFQPEGRWVKILLDTDTTQKIIKGGHILSYRALVVVGNIKGCGGWGIGKGASLEEAKARAYRAAKKNLIHVDLYRNRCITTPLYGKHNNCRIYIQAGHPLKHHKEGRMVNDILRAFGVESGEARSVGRRNPYSVVRAVFDAMSKHVGVEEVARKRGRRLISVSKARYMNL